MPPHYPVPNVEKSLVGGVTHDDREARQWVMTRTREAVIGFTVWCLGLGALGLVYLNYVLIRPYFNPFFYAAVLSVPLHGIKVSLTERLEAFLKDDQGEGGTRGTGLGWRDVVWWMMILGIFWHLFSAMFTVYVRLIHRISTPHNRKLREKPKPTETPPSLSKTEHESLRGRKHATVRRRKERKGMRLRSVSESDIHTRWNGVDTSTSSSTSGDEPILEPLQKLSRELSSMILLESEASDEDIPLQRSHVTLRHPISFRRPDSTRPLSRKRSFSQTLPAALGIRPPGFTTAPKGQYLQVLFLWVVRYALFRFVVERWGASSKALSSVGMGVVCGGVCYFGWHVWLGVYRRYFVVIDREHKKVRDTTGIVETGLWRRAVGSLQWGLGWCYQNCRVGSKRWLRRNLNGLLSGFLIISTLVTAFGGGGFLLFKVGQETGLIIDDTIRFVNRSVLANDELRGQALRFVSDLEARTVAYLERDKSSANPSDLTAQELFDMIHKSIEYLALVRNDADAVVDGKKKPRPTPTKTTPAERGIFDMLPQTGDLLLQVFRGNFNLSSLADQLPPATDELRSHGLNLLDTVLRLLDKDASTLSNASAMPASLGTFAAHTVQFLGGAAVALVVLLVVGVTYAFDVLFQWILFLASLYAFVAGDVGVVGHAGRVIGLVDPKQKLRHALEHAVQSALIVNLKLTLYHMLSTYLSHSVTHLDLVYIPTFITGLATLIPIVPSWYFAIPAAIRLWTRMSGWWGVVEGGGLLMVHLIVAWVIDPAILEEEMGHLADSHHVSSTGPNLLLTGLAFWLGYYQFGFPLGLVLGPLVVSCVPIVVGHLYGEFVGVGNADG
ncbi:hypothetical protein SpCBS45565_g03892 [Spizellomyces sp. 'palustris']|nr:hypothetical protein SpCBS45565_g03892 [Spizellomyces sp. 'palustris']